MSNQYRPWVQYGMTEVEYWKMRYIEAIKQPSDAEADELCIEALQSAVKRKRSAQRAKRAKDIRELLS